MHLGRGHAEDLRQKIEAGLKDAEEGRTIAHEEVFVEAAVARVNRYRSWTRVVKRVRHRSSRVKLLIPLGLGSDDEGRSPARPPRKSTAPKSSPLPSTWDRVRI